MDSAQPNASRQDLMDLGSSVMRSEPAGTLCSNSMVARIGHLVSRMSRSTLAIGVPASPKGVFGPVPLFEVLEAFEQEKNKTPDAG